MSETKIAKMGFEQAGAAAQTRLGDCLWDAHAAGSKIVEFTTGRSFAEFDESELLRSVVEKMLEIMEEALGEMRQYFPDEFAKLDGRLQLVDRPGTTKEMWRMAKEVVPEIVVQLQTILEEWHQA